MVAANRVERGEEGTDVFRARGGREWDLERGLSEFVKDGGPRMVC